MGDQIDLRRYFALFLRWLWLVVLCTVLAAGSAYLISRRMTPVYSAWTTLLVHQAPSSRTTDYQAIVTSERLARTYSQMITGRPVLEAAAVELGYVPAGVQVSPVEETQLIRLSVMDTDPVRAAAAADAVAEAFIAFNRGLQQERYADSLFNVQQQMDELAAQIDATQGAISALGTPRTTAEQAELAQLEGILAGYRTAYATLVRDYEDMRLTAVQSSDDVIVFEDAEVPLAPIRPRTLFNTAAAGLVGALLAAGAALLVEFLDDTVKSPEDVSRALSLGSLGTIGKLDRADGELVTAAEPLSPISEAFRVLRTNIRFYGVDRPLRTVLVTSPGPTEGKSFTAANLAVTMAQAGLKVVAVDCDLRRPRLHTLFGIHPREGLTGSLLAGSTDGRLQPVEQMEGLSLLPAGELPPNPAEMLGSQRMRDLLGHLAEEADVVVIDSPPVLPVTDAAIMAQGVDGVLLVLDVGSTRRGAARQAVESLQQVGGKVVGAVLNRVPTRGRGYYYYHYRDYYSGSERPHGRRQRGLPGLLRRLSRRGGQPSGSR